MQSKFLGKLDSIYTIYKGYQNQFANVTCQKAGITMEPHITPRVATHITLHVEAHLPIQDAISSATRHFRRVFWGEFVLLLQIHPYYSMEYV